MTASSAVAGPPAQARLWACSDPFDAGLLVRYAAFMPGGGDWTIEATLVGGGEVVLLDDTGLPDSQRQTATTYAGIGSWQVERVTLTVHGSDGETGTDSVEGPFRTCTGCSQPMPRSCDFRGPSRQEPLASWGPASTTAFSR